MFYRQKDLTSTFPKEILDLSKKVRDNPKSLRLATELLIAGKSEIKKHFSPPLFPTPYERTLTYGGKEKFQGAILYTRNSHEHSYESFGVLLRDEKFSVTLTTIRRANLFREMALNSNVLVWERIFNDPRILFLPGLDTLSIGILNDEMDIIEETGYDLINLKS